MARDASTDAIEGADWDPWEKHTHRFTPEGMIEHDEKIRRETAREIRNDVAKVLAGFDPRMIAVQRARTEPDINLSGTVPASALARLQEWLEGE